MDFKNKATRINLFSLGTPQMRAFHLTWFAFFLCFFGALDRPLFAFFQGWKFLFFAN